MRGVDGRTEVDDVAGTVTIELTDEQHAYWECAVRRDDAPSAVATGDKVRATVLADVDQWVANGYVVQVVSSDGAVLLERSLSSKRRKRR